jgi:hypothetical protein
MRSRDGHRMMNKTSKRPLDALGFFSPESFQPFIIKNFANSFGTCYK